MDIMYVIINYTRPFHGASEWAWATGGVFSESVYETTEIPPFSGHNLIFVVNATIIMHHGFWPSSGQLRVECGYYGVI